MIAQHVVVDSSPARSNDAVIQTLELIRTLPSSSRTSVHHPRGPTRVCTLDPVLAPNIVVCRVVEATSPAGSLGSSPFR